NFSLHHIDRQDNGHADRLANRALDQKNTLVECATHPGRNACTPSTAPRPEKAAGPLDPPPPLQDPHSQTAAAASTSATPPLGTLIESAARELALLGSTAATRRGCEETKTEDNGDGAAGERAGGTATRGPATHVLVRADHGRHGPVFAVYAHNATAFGCSRCAFSTRSLATLTRHRRLVHRNVRFVDHFHSDCGIEFQTRAAVTRHARACAPSAAVAAVAPPAPTALLPAAPDAAAAGTPAPAAAQPQTCHLPRQLCWRLLCPLLQRTHHHPGLSHRRRLWPRQWHQATPWPQPPSPSRAPYCLLRGRLGANDGASTARDCPMQDAFATTPASTATAQPQAALPRTGANSPQLPQRGPRTRWGPCPSSSSAERTTTSEQAAQPAVRRPLAPAAPVAGATRWGPSHRAIGAAAIARLVTGLHAAPAPARRSLPASLPPTSEAPPPTAMDVDTAAPDVEVSDAAQEHWLLRFDGACRRNPGPGGAGAALFAPDGKVVWTVAHYMAGRETNNTAEYTAMLLDVRSALHHGVRRLRVEGDSHLALSQVRGTFACNNKRLRSLRNRMQAALRGLEWHRLMHIDRKANQHADRLANRALDLKRTVTECGPHSGALGLCLQPPPPAPATADVDMETPAPSNDQEPTGVDMLDDEAADDEAEVAARDGGEVFPTIPIGPASAPAKQPRLCLRQLSEDEFDKAAAAVTRVAAELASKIADVDDWATGEGYIAAIPTRLREALQPFSVPPPRPAPPQPRPHHGQPPPRRRPPRVTRDQLEHRQDEALDAMTTAPRDQRKVRKARRRVGRIRSAMNRARLRKLFAQNERACVQEILRGASPETATAPATDECPIDRDTLFKHFSEACSQRTPFDYNGEHGEEFRAVLEKLPVATKALSALTAEPTLDEIEDQLGLVKPASSPGHDGVGYDVYRRFQVQLLPLLLAAFKLCWHHRKVPALWKVGIVRLVHKKGDPTEPANWRPVCLQTAIYKLYSGLLARRLSRFLEANDRLTISQKGFRAFNGCHEHNFVATTLLEQTRRIHRRLYQVWYDLRNAFGSLAQQLMWEVLRRLGVTEEFVGRCSGIYDDSSFVVGNASDGATDPVRQEVGAYQGCPLSPLLFIVALVPLLRALEQLDGVGVPLADGVRPCATAYADDIKVFSDSAAGIQRCHAVVERFLAWTGLRANPAKCAFLPVTRDQPSNPTRDHDIELRIHGEAIATLGLKESYRYLGVGDGFDHVSHRLQLEPKLKQIKQEAVALMRSELAPWQILKALKVYIYPKVEYALRHVRPLDSQLEVFDRAIVRGLRHLLRLPDCSHHGIFISPTSSGGLGLLSLVELHKALQVAHAWQMLHSKDPDIRAIARAQVGQVARKRFKLNEEHWRGRDDELTQLFLNTELAASPYATQRRRTGDISSLWTDVRQTLATLGLKLQPGDDDSAPGLLQLRVPHHTK
ncbi:hypothetical protein PR001_g24022, partial [Phytophthora rubi]